MRETVCACVRVGARVIIITGNNTRSGQVVMLALQGLGDPIVNNGTSANSPFPAPARPSVPGARFKERRIPPPPPPYPVRPQSL